MPHIRRVCLVAIALAATGPAAWAVPPVQPVCNRPEVLDIVAGDLAFRDLGAALVPGGIGQVPTGSPGTVRCAVRVRTTFFDTNRFGYAPQYRLSVLEFTVRAARNGLFVDAVGSPR